MKKTYAPTSNPNFNVPMTNEQWTIIDLIAFFSETAIKYPFKVKFNDLTMDDIDKIIVDCTDIENNDLVLDSCEKILGTIED